ncbi:MAG: hypothetical protein ACRD3N_02830 [Terracidiphilus sp.]
MLFPLTPAAQPSQKLSSLPNDPSAVKLPPLKDHFLIDHLPLKPAAPLLATIPVDPLDFAAPSAAYFGLGYSWVSLRFLDENHLLFTFRVPGLIVRTPGSNEGDERHIRAVVLSLPSGAVTAESMWTLHDRQRYLWLLRGGRFLLRDRNTLYEGDASLQLKPVLRFPGPLLWVELDPTQQLLATDSREPAATPAKAGEVSGPVTAAAVVAQDGDSSGGKPGLVFRILRRESGQVIAVSRVRGEVHLPIGANGYLDSVRDAGSHQSAAGSQWTVNLNYFSGGTSELGLVESECSPTLDFVSARELLATTCKRDGGYRFTAFSINGLPLWQDSTSGYTVWPILSTSLNGLRIVRETLAVTHQIGAYWALDRGAVKAQRVRVFDAADGNMAFEATVDPVLDAGGNAAISPSGRRVAILNAGAIQVYDLPAPPPLPKAADSSP